MHNLILDRLRLIRLRFPSIGCYVASDWNVNLLDDSLHKSRALRSFTAAGQLVEATAELPLTWRGERGNNFVFSKIDHVFTSGVADIEAGFFPNPDSDPHVIYMRPPPLQQKIYN